MKENDELLEENEELLKISKILSSGKIEEENLNIIHEEEEMDNLPNYNNKDSSDEEDFNNIDSKNKIKKLNRKILIYNIKDIILMFSLLLSSSLNFSILYIPLVLIGITYIYFLLNNNNDIKKIKFKIEIFCLIYSILIIGIKVGMIISIACGHFDSEEQIEQLNNFGIKYSKNNNHIFYVIITFIGEILILIVSIYSLFISVLYKEIDLENKYRQTTKEKIFTKIKFTFYMSYILLLFFAIYNRSYLTHLYLFLYHILLIIIILRNNFPLIFRIFIYIRIFFIIVLTLQLLMINILNIYYLQVKYLKKNIIPEGAEGSDIKKVYSIFTIIGINYSYYHSILTFIYEWLSYFFCVSVIVLLSSMKLILNDYKLLFHHKKTMSELKNIDELNIDHDTSKKKKKKKKNVVEKIKLFLIFFFTRPNSIAHLVRILSIFWIYYLRNFFSIGIFIYLFFSFLVIDVRQNRRLIIFLLIPTIIITFGCLHICNINGYFENIDENEKEMYIRFGLEKDGSNRKYFSVGLYYLLIILFLNSFTDNNSVTKVQIKLNKNNNRLLTENEIIDESFLSDNKEPLLSVKNEKGENEEIYENKEIKNKDNKKIIKISDVILKFIYQNIDKITLVAMYFISMHTINIIHLIFIIIFIIQIVQPKIVQRYYKIIIINIQAFFLFEYIIDLTKCYYINKFQENLNVFKLILSYDENNKEINIYNEIFCYVAVYAFYIQNQLVSSIKYQELEKNSNISLKIYINSKFKNYKLIKYILLLIFNIIIEIYVWCMFCIFFYICCNFEINLLFSIKLLLFLCVLYNFLIKIQIIEKNVNISLKYNSFLTNYCCLNCLIVYIYQLFCLDIFQLDTRIKESNIFIIQNLPSIGLINYENKSLLTRLFPHFLSIFLSIMLHYQLKTIYDRIEKERLLNNDIEKDEEKDKVIDNNNTKIIYIGDNKMNDDNKKNKNIDNEDNENIIKDIKNDLNQEENNEISTKNIVNENNLDLDNIIENKEEIIRDKKDNSQNNNDDLVINLGEEENKYYVKYCKLKDKISNLNNKYILFSIILFILKLYHPFLFLLICYIFTSHHLSLTMIIYFLIFGLNFIVMFRNLLNNTCNYNYNHYHPFFITQLIRYNSIEAKKRKTICNINKYKSFKYLSFFSFIFLLQNYIYSILHDLQDCNNNNIDITKSKCNNNTTLIEKSQYGNIIKVYAYLLGIYNYSNTKELIKSSGLYILFCLLLCINIYVQRIEMKIDDKINNNRKDHYNFYMKKRHLKTILYYIEKIKEKKDIKINENYKVLEELIKNYENIEENGFTKFTIDNNFENNFINIFKESKNNKLLLAETSLKRNLIVFLRIGKKIIEYLIIFILMCGVIIKVNIWSLIYMLIVLYLLLTKKNINKFNYLFKFIIISILIQSIIFLSNINEEIIPKTDENIIQLIKETTIFPLYDQFQGNNKIRHSILLGLGINKSQLLLIWFEYILVFIIYIYIYYFSYSIFNSKNYELKEWRKTEKSLIYKLLLNSEYSQALIDMKNTHQYEKIAKCMKKNFGVKLLKFPSVLEFINKNIEIDNNISIFSQKKEKEFKITLLDYLFFLFFHNIIIITIAIISMMIYGLFSAIYICFCLYFLFKTKSINKGEIYKYPLVIKSLLRPIIIVDISLQLALQICYIYIDNFAQKGFLKNLFDFIGLERIINEKYEITSDILLLLGKSFCFFCMCIQKVIYTSRSFNEFYLKYLIIKNKKFKIIAFINTFKYNNERINTMNNSLQLKKDMENLMKNLHNDLKEWNKKLFNEDSDIINSSKNTIIIKAESNISKKDIKDIKDNDNNINNFNSEINLLNINNNNSENNLINIDNIYNFSLNEDKLVDEETIRKIVKKWIMGQTFLVKIHIYLNKYAFCYRMISNEKERDKYIINIIKGINEYVPIMERKINEEISKLDLSSFKFYEIGTLKDYLKRLNKINSYDFIKIIFFLNNESEINKQKKRKLNESLKILIQQKKYRQFSKIKNSKLFKKYLRQSFLLQKIIIDIISIITNNFNWVCYFVMILNHILNASIISLFYPLSIFCYAILENPRPSRKYWNICLIYTFIFLIIKCFIQNKFIGGFLNIENGSETYYTQLKTFLECYPIGIILFDDNVKYFLYLIIDFMVLIVIYINVHILMVNGLWENSEKYIENIYEGMQRLCLNKDKVFENEMELKTFNDEYLSEKVSTNRYIKRRITIYKSDKNLYKNYIKNLKNKYIEETKNYFQKLIPNIRNEKPGKDFYFVYSFSMILIVFYILFFYTKMVQDKTYGSVNISTNLFSGMSIIFVLIFMLILIYDRVIYLSQNRYNLKYEYSFYNKKKQVLIDEGHTEYNEIKENIIKLYPNCNRNNDFKIPLEYFPELNKNYDILFFQNEPLNIPLLEKYILYMLLTVLSHAFIFFFIPMVGNYNLNNAVYCIREKDTDECNYFLDNKSTVIFYLLFLHYLIFSGLQIKYGFYDLKRKSIFKNINSIHGLLFEVYKLIPFYYPIKNVVDWTFTPTSLTLFDWFKFESIYDTIFKTYRMKKPIENKPIGKKIQKVDKLLKGGITSFILIAILVLPLILFSSLNPTNEINNISSAEMKIYLSFINNYQQEKNYLIFENNWAENIYVMNDEVWNNFKYYNSFYTKTFPREQIQVVSFYSEPENSLSDFKLSHIMASIKSLLNDSFTQTEQEQLKKCKLKIEANFIRSLPNEAKNVKIKSELLICDTSSSIETDGCKGLNQSYNFFNSDTDSDDYNINVYGFSPFVRLTASSEPKSIDLENEEKKKIIVKPSYKNKTYLFEIYFDNVISKKGIQYHVFSDKVSSSTSGYSVIGFYSAFILVIGAYVTSFFNYNPEKIINGEMPHPEKLLNLCECVKISRYTYDFKKEEYLFNILIEILRTPDFIKKLTESTIEQFQRRISLPA